MNTQIYTEHASAGEHTINSCECCSVFVSTRVGQIRNELELISQYAPKHPRALLMTPVRDKQLRTTMVGMVETSSFETYELAILPNYPASQRTFYKRPQLYKIMREALQKLVGSATTVHLYLHHANRYYAYFERILLELDIATYTINMVEEGMATYRWSCPGMEDLASQARQYQPKESLARIGSDIKRAVRHVLSFVKALLHVIVHAFELIVAVLSVLTRKNLFDAGLRALAHLQAKKYHFGIVRHFDTGYFCFPEKMKHTKEITIDVVYPLALAKEEKRPDALQNVDAVFASQRYGNPSVYYEIVLSIFEEMGLRSVFFKLHPREEFSQVMPYLQAASDNHPSIHIIHDRRLDGVPLETLLAEQDCGLVVGLTTSTLMYAPLIRSDLRAVSIGRRFYELYCKNDPAHLGGQGLELATFRDDLQSFCAIFPEVEQFVPRKEPPPEQKATP